MPLRLLICGGAALLSGTLLRSAAPTSALPAASPAYTTRPSSAKEFALAARRPQPTLMIARPAAVVIGKTSITIRLPGKSARVLKDDVATVQETGVRTYEYVGQLRELPYYVFHVNYYEDDAYLLVHRRSGASTLLIGRPLVSATARYVACRTTEFGLQGAPNGVQVFAADSTGLHKLADLDQTAWLPAAILWTADDRLLVKADPTGMPGSSISRRYFALIPRRS